MINLLKKSRKNKRNEPKVGTLEYVRDWAMSTHVALNSRDDVVIGDYTYGCPSIRMGGGMAKCIIGKFCSIASEVSIHLISDHNPNWISTYDLSILLSGIDCINHLNHENCVVKGDVVIGNNVWIGERVIILPGVTIDDGAVIAAGSIVTKSVPAYTLGGGVPYKPFRKRFSDENIEILENLKWWDWSEDKILKGLKYIENSSVKELLKFHEKYENNLRRII